MVLLHVARFACPTDNADKISARTPEAGRESREVPEVASAVREEQARAETELIITREEEERIRRREIAMVRRIAAIARETTTRAERAIGDRGEADRAEARVRIDEGVADAALDDLSQDSPQGPRVN